MNEDVKKDYDDEYAVEENADRGDVVGDADKKAEEKDGDKDAHADADQAAKDAATVEAAVKKAAEDAARDDKGRFKSKDKEKAEGETDKDEEEEDDGEEEEGGDKPQNFEIRLNKMREQRNRERERAAALEAELRVSKKADATPTKDPIAEISEKLDGLYEQVEEARAGADTKLAAQLQRQIDTYNRDIARIESTRTATYVSEATRVDSTYNAMMDHLENAHPELLGNDEASAALRSELQFNIDAYEKAGMTATGALRRAAILFFKADPFVKREPVKDVPEAKPPEKKPEAKKPDVTKALDTMRKTPPDSADRGQNIDDKKIDVAALEDDEFDKLPEATKRKLRGDTL